MAEIIFPPTLEDFLQSIKDLPLEDAIRKKEIEVDFADVYIDRMERAVVTWGRKYRKYVDAFGKQHLECIRIKKGLDYRLNELDKTIDYRDGLLEEIEREEELIVVVPPIVVPPPPPIVIPPTKYIGIDSETGEEIWYHTEREKYRMWSSIQGRYIYYSSLQISVTFSIETDGGHEPFGVENTAVVVIEKRSKYGIEWVVDKVVEAVGEYYALDFGPSIGGGSPWLLSAATEPIDVPKYGDMVELRDVLNLPVLKVGVEYHVTDKKASRLIDLRVEKFRIRKGVYTEQLTLEEFK